jgi:FkbM family methyltransferase
LEYFPKSTIYAFEPSADSFRVLKKNLTPHLSRVRLFPFGFSSESGKAFLNITSFHGANSLVGMSRDYLNGHPDIRLLRHEEVQLITLDDFVDEHSVEHIDLVKIDVEGSERQILNGGKETFMSRVDSVLMEVSLTRHGFDSDEWIQLIQKMHAYGFDLIAIYDVSYNRWPYYGMRLEFIRCYFEDFSPLCER